MNILHLSTEKSWRGGENQILMLARGLRERGIVCHAAFPKGAAALEAFQKEQIPCLELKSRSPVDIRNLGVIADYCSTHKIHIINTHSSGAHSLALMVKYRLPGLKLVVHRRVAFPPKNNFFSRKKYLSDSVDKFVAISNACAQPLLKMGVEPDRIRVVHSAVNVDRFLAANRDEAAKNLRSYLEIPDDYILIGSASALTMEKGIHVLLKAAKKLRDAGHKFAVTIAGKGNLDKELQELAKTFDVTGCVHFVGFIEDMPAYLAALDIFVMPSLEEGLGTAALQAMAARCCVVSSNAGGLPEVVIHEETGLIAKKTSSTHIFRHVERLINDPELREKLAQNGFDRVRHEFNLVKMLDNSQRIYQNLMNG